MGKNDFLEYSAEECPKHHFMQAAPPGVQTTRLKTMDEMEERGDFLNENLKWILFSSLALFFSCDFVKV